MGVDHHGQGSRPASLGRTGCAAHSAGQSPQPEQRHRYTRGAWHYSSMHLRIGKKVKMHEAMVLPGLGEAKNLIQGIQGSTSKGARERVQAPARGKRSRGTYVMIHVDYSSAWRWGMSRRLPPPGPLSLVHSSAKPRCPPPGLQSLWTSQPARATAPLPDA